MPHQKLFYSKRKNKNYRSFGIVKKTIRSNIYYKKNRRSNIYYKKNRRSNIYYGKNRKPNSYYKRNINRGISTNKNLSDSNYLYYLDKSPFYSIIKYDYNLFLKKNPYTINTLAY
jgi:hypothetical protein